MSGSSIYRELLGKYDENTIPQRIAYLKNKMKLFLQVAGAESFAVVNDNILCHTVIDYFADINRMKDFHNITYTNKEKIIAYTAYWVCRRKPIQLAQRRVDDSFAFINEAFITTFIEDELYQFTKKNNPSEELKTSLFYHLKYRHIDSQSLELLVKAYINGTLSQPQLD